MAMIPWRMQGDLKKGETDPIMTVFLGPEVAVLDGDGNPTNAMTIYQETGSPLMMKLSEVVAALLDPKKMEAARQAAKKAQPLPPQPPA